MLDYLLFKIKYKIVNVLKLYYCEEFNFTDEDYKPGLRVNFS